MFRSIAVSALVSVATIASAEEPPASQTVRPQFVTPTPVPNTVVLPGDDALDCPTIRAEGDYRLAQYQSLGRERDGIDFKKGGETRALEVAGMIGGSIPILGELIGMGSLLAQVGTAKKDALTNFGEIDRKSEWVLNRMSHMHETYRTRCMKGTR